jgi:sugar lactone lactonase YvrE
METVAADVRYRCGPVAIHFPQESNSMKNRLSSGFLAICLFAIFNVVVHAQTDLGVVVLGQEKTATISVTIPTARTLTSISVVTSGAPNLDFIREQGGGCTTGIAYQAGAVCTVRVEFEPRYPGARDGAVVLRDQFEDIVGITYLHGRGLGPRAAFLPATLTQVSSGFTAPQGLAVDGSGNFYVAQNLFFPGGFGGGDPVYGGVAKGTSPTNQTSIGQEWVDPSSVAVDGAGNVFVSDFVGGIWKLTLHSDKSYSQSLAVSGGSGVAVDGSGNLYTIEVGTDLYKETLQKDGSYLPTKIATGFITPTSVAVDESGNVYVTDTGDQFASTPGAALYKETLSKGKYTRTAIGKGWVQPSAVAVDGVGNIYVNDSGSVYKEILLENGQYSQTVVASKVAAPGGVAVDAAGSVYVTEYSGIGDYGMASYSVFRLDYTRPAGLNFDQATKRAISDDSPKTVTVANFGNARLNFWGVVYPANFPESSTGTGDCTVLTSLEAGENCTVTVEFVPRGGAGRMKTRTLWGQVEVITNSMNSPIAEQSIRVSGTVVSQGPPGKPKRAITR